MLVNRIYGLRAETMVDGPPRAFRLYGSGVFMTNFAHQQHDERVTPGEFSVLFESISRLPASLL